MELKHIGTKLFTVLPHYIMLHLTNLQIVYDALVYIVVTCAVNTFITGFHRRAWFFYVSRI